MAAGTFYLRPSADVSLEHWTAYGTRVDGYLKINEEVADGDSTYIFADDGGNVLTSVFSMSFGGAVEPDRVTSARLVVVSKVSNSTATSSSDCPTTYTVSLDNGAQDSVTYAETSSSYVTAEFDLSSLADAINGYIKTSGVFPAVTLTIASTTPAGGSKAEYSLDITQVYIAIDYETADDIGIHVKRNGAWEAAKSAYQKQNGAWVGITADECKAILQSNKIKQ